MPRPVAIIGAGVAGLVAGRELARRGHAVTLYERWPDVAGQASAFDLGGGVWIDRYYHHLFQSDSDMIALHDELLPGELEWHTSTVGMWSRGRTWPFVGPVDLLRYGPLPPIDRMRLGLAVLRLSSRTDWERMDDIPALEWLRAACGQRAVDAVWTPLMLGKFGKDSDRIPLAWLWSKLTLRRRLRGSGAAKEQLGYPRRSFQAIARALADDVRKLGGTIEVDREVVRVTEDGGYVLHCAAPGAFRRPAFSAPAEAALEARAEVVLFTTPTFVTRRLTAWPREFDARLDQWSYKTAVVLLLELRRPFSATYWTNIADRSVPFLGLIEHTNLVPAERYPARYLYVSNYVAPDDPLTRMSKEELLRHYLAGLKRINPAFEEHDAVRYWSFREEAAQPVPTIGNRHRILPFTSPRPGLYVANTTQIYPEDRGTNYSARLGREVAAHIAADG
ncbi:MAG TPA: NAD(P)/FAD-dependent oxidoreductase [Candidatus Limnocylindria bacterium]|nr:NAD(P)/FAD-dependent oxidoreductase [Candidatus Limnocylindria bacterium]